MRRKPRVLYARNIALGRHIDSFENGIFWELYLDLERQFQNFLEYLPYLEGNEYAYSFRLLNIILGVGSHVDSAFKEMAKYKKFANNADCQKILKLVRKSEENLSLGKAPATVSIKLCLRAFEHEYNLSTKSVLFKRLPEREGVIPFKPSNSTTNAPGWWEIYNGLKHNLSINLEDANLHSSMQALAGAFLLNVIHEPAILRLYDYGLLWCVGGGIPREQLIDMLHRKQKLFCSVETPLFIYDYEQS